MESMISVFSALAGVFLGICYKKLWVGLISSKKKSPLLGFTEDDESISVIKTGNPTVLRHSYMMTMDPEDFEMCYKIAGRRILLKKEEEGKRCSTNTY